MFYSKGIGFFIVMVLCLVGLYYVKTCRSMKFEQATSFESMPSTTTENCIIRKATILDEQGLKKLYKKVADIPGGLARTEHEITDAYIHKTLANGIDRGLVLVVEDHGVIIGSMIKYRLEPKIFSHVLNDGSILIHPDYQGKGIGSKLISWFLQEIQDNHPNILRVEIIARESNPALKLYEKMGFKQEGRFEGRIQGVHGSLEADIPMAWMNPNFDKDLLINNNA